MKAPGQNAGEPGGFWAPIRGNVLTLGIVSLLTDLSSEMIYPLLPLFFSGLVPAAQVAVYVGLMEGIAEATASVLKLVSGRVSDLLGRRKLLAVAGYGLSSSCRPLMALAAAGWHVIFLRFLDRVGKGVRTSPRDALIGDSVSARVRGRAFSFHRAMDHLGAIMGPLAAVGVLYAFLGYGLWTGSAARASAREMHALRWLFALALIPGLLSMIALVSRVREIAPSGRGVEDGPARIAGGVKRLPRRFFAFVGITTLFALGNSSDLFIVFFGQTRFNMGLVQVIGLWIVLHLSKAAFSLPGGMLSDRFGRRPLLVGGWLLYAGVYLGFAVVTEPWAFWALIAAYGCYYGMTEGVEKALVTDFVRSADRGAAFGMFHGAVGLAALPASVMFGLLWRFIGAQAAFGIGAALAGTAAFLIVWIGPPRDAGGA